MLNERLRKRLKKDRPTTTITMRIPVDVVESLKAFAPTEEFLDIRLFSRATSARVCGGMRLCTRS